MVVTATIFQLSSNSCLLIFLTHDRLLEQVHHIHTLSTTTIRLSMSIDYQAISIKITETVNLVTYLHGHTCRVCRVMPLGVLRFCPSALSDCISTGTEADAHKKQVKPWEKLPWQQDVNSSTVQFYRLQRGRSVLFQTYAEKTARNNEPEIIRSLSQPSQS